MGCEGSKSKSNRTVEPIGELLYFDVNGRGEMIRLLLRHADVNFTDKRISMSDWPALKPQYPGGLPYWT